MTEQETRNHLLTAHSFSADYVRKAKTQPILNWHKREHKTGESKFGEKHTHD